MTIFQSLILGVIQGITEFLPISSTGHLVLTPFLLGWNIPENQAFVFDVLVQVATLVAVVAYFWKDLFSIFEAMLLGIWRKQPLVEAQSRLGWYIVLATFPAGLAGLALNGTLEAVFGDPPVTALFLLFTAVLLIIAERLGHRQRTLDKLNWKDALIIGFFQIFALFPGISRSGATITGAMSRDLERPTAARFSFLMSIPILLAAGLLATLDLIKIPNLSSILPSFIPGFLASAIVGYLSIRWLLRYLVHHSLYIFVLYCTALSVISLAVYFIGR